MVVYNSCMEKIRSLCRELPNSKLGSVINFAIRLLFYPAFLAYELACLPERIATEEADGYKYFKGLKGGNAASLKHDAKIFIKRFSECWAESGPLWFQAVFYVIMLDLFAALGVQHILRNFRSEIESLTAAFSGNWYVSYDGHKHALSLTAGGEHYKLPAGHCLGRHCCLCPVFGGQKSRTHDCMCNASFFAACCKLSYESYPIIEDVINHRWNMKLMDHREIHANLHLGYEYVPDVKWFVARSRSAIVVCFTGAQLFHKIDRVTDIPTSISEYPACGRMADGLVRGLQQSCGSSSSLSVFEVIESLLKASDVEELYLTGHSLGGALSVIFANILFDRNAELTAKIKGIFTFGAPRIGDLTFADTIQQKFGGRIFRYTHGADMVVKLPHSFQSIPFVNHCGHRFITSFPVPGKGIRVLKEEDEPKLLAAIEKHEASFAHVNGFAKTIIAAMRGQWFDVNARLMLLAMPGIADHFPGEYQRALDDSLRIQFQDFHDFKELD